MLKKVIAIVLLASVLISGTACKSGKKVTATVNGQPIYEEDVNKQLEQIGQQHQQLQGEQKQQYLEQFRKQIVNDLIDQELVLQEAENANIKVTNKEIDEWIKQIRKQFPSEKEFNAKLKEVNMTMADLKKSRREQIQRQKILEKITKGIKVSDKETEDYYAKHPDEFKDPEKIQIKWIVVPDEKKAKEVRQQLEDGGDFAKAAKDNSIDPATKDSGGDMGSKSKNELAPEIADVAFKAEPNKISEVIKTQQGFAIIEVGEKKPERQKSYEESKSEIQNKLLSEKQRKAYESWLKKVKSKAKIDKGN